MGGDGSIAEGIFWAVRFMGDIALRWVPGVVQVVTGTAPQIDSMPVLTPITEPVTTADVTHFLASASSQGAYERLFHNWSIFVAVSTIISLLLLALLVYCGIRILQIRQFEKHRIAAAGQSVAARDVSKTQLRWERVIEQARSENEQGWRLAILEADIMLNELLDVLGYRGDTMSDKMKQATRASFNTIDLAWDAHRVRNSIAHQGSGRHLNARETRRVIGLYEQVFREFRFIA